MQNTPRMFCYLHSALRTEKYQESVIVSYNSTMDNRSTEVLQFGTSRNAITKSVQQPISITQK